MTNILCRIKDTEGKGVQEITTRQETHDRTNGKTSTILQETRDLFNLRNFFIIVTTVLNQERQDILMFTTSMSRIHGCQTTEDLTPGFIFLISVLNFRNRLTSTISLCNTSDFSSSSTINGIMSTGMIRTYVLFTMSISVLMYVASWEINQKTYSILHPFP